MAFEYELPDGTILDSENELNRDQIVGFARKVGLTNRSLDPDEWQKLPGGIPFITKDDQGADRQYFSVEGGRRVGTSDLQMGEAATFLSNIDGSYGAKYSKADRDKIKKAFYDSFQKSLQEESTLAKRFGENFESGLDYIMFGDVVRGEQMPYHLADDTGKSEAIKQEISRRTTLQVLKSKRDQLLNTIETSKDDVARRAAESEYEMVASKIKELEAPEAELATSVLTGEKTRVGARQGGPKPVQTWSDSELRSGLEGAEARIQRDAPKGVDSLVNVAERLGEFTALPAWGTDVSGLRGAAEGVAALGGQIAPQFGDPVNYIPFFGPMSKVKNVALFSKPMIANMTKSMGNAVMGTVAVEPEVQRQRMAVGVQNGFDWDMAKTGTLMAGGMGLSIPVIGKFFSRAFQAAGDGFRASDIQGKSIAEVLHMIDEATGSKKGTYERLLMKDLNANRGKDDQFNNLDDVKKYAEEEYHKAAEAELQAELENVRTWEAREVERKTGVTLEEQKLASEARERGDMEGARDPEKVQRIWDEEIANADKQREKDVNDLIDKKISAAQAKKQAVDEDEALDLLNEQDDIDMATKLGISVEDVAEIREARKTQRAKRREEDLWAEEMETAGRERQKAERAEEKKAKKDAAKLEAEAEGVVGKADPVTRAELDAAQQAREQFKKGIDDAPAEDLTPSQKQELKEMVDDNKTVPEIRRRYAEIHAENQRMLKQGKALEKAEEERMLRSKHYQNLEDLSARELDSIAAKVGVPRGIRHQDRSIENLKKLIWEKDQKMGSNLATEVKAEGFKKRANLYAEQEGFDPIPKKKKLQDRAADASDRIAERLGGKKNFVESDVKGGVISPEMLSDLATVGAAIIEKGIKNFASWSSEMMSRFGDAIRPFLDDMWDFIGRNIEDYMAGKGLIKYAVEPKKGRIPAESPAKSKTSRVTAQPFTQELSKGRAKFKTLVGGLGDEAYNYTTKDGVEVTIKDPDVIPEIHGTQMGPNIEIDVVYSTNRGKGLASKEMDRITKLADKRDMSISLRVDPSEASKGGERGMGINDLISWYERKGFVFEEDGLVGYRPKKSEDISSITPQAYKAKRGEIDPDKIESHSSPEDMYDSLRLKTMKKGFQEDGSDRLWHFDGKQLRRVENADVEFKFGKWEDGKQVSKGGYQVRYKDEDTGTLKSRAESAPKENIPAKEGGNKPYATWEKLKKMGYRDEDASATQIATTKSTYEKIAPTIKKGEEVLDYAAGLGHGTKALKDELKGKAKVVGYEPFTKPSKRVVKPEHTDGSKIPDESADVIVNNAVLNVVPKETRIEILDDIYRILKPNGRAFVNLMGWNSIKGRLKTEGNVLVGPREVVKKGGTFQKGYNQKDFVEFVKHVLPDAKIETWSSHGVDGGDVKVVIRKPDSPIKLDEATAKTPVVPESKRTYKPSRETRSESTEASMNIADDQAPRVNTPLDDAIPETQTKGTISGSKAEKWADEVIDNYKADMYKMGIAHQAQAPITANDLRMIGALAVKTAAKMERGYIKFNEWYDYMLRSIGEAFRPVADIVWKKATEYLDRAMNSKYGLMLRSNIANPHAYLSHALRATKEGDGVIESMRMNPQMADGIIEVLRRERYPAIMNAIKGAAEQLGIDQAVLYEKLNAYAIAKRALYVNKRFGEGASGDAYTTTKANDILNEARNDGSADLYEELLADVYQLNKEALDIRKEYGLISQDQFDRITSNDPDYVPFNRVLDDEVDPLDALYGEVRRQNKLDDPIYRSSQVRTSGVRRMKGSELEINDVIQNSIANIEDAISRSRRNDSMISLADTVRGAGEVYKGVIDVKDVPIISTRTDKATGKKFPVYAKIDEKAGQIAFMENGKKKMFVVPREEIRSDILGLTKGDDSLLAKLIAPATKMMAMAFTTLNLKFAPRNFVRDTREVAMNVDRMLGSSESAKINLTNGLQSAAVVWKYLASTSGGFREWAGNKMPSAMRSYFDAVTPEDMRMYQEFLKDGGSAQGLGRIAVEEVRGNAQKMYTMIDELRGRGFTREAWNKGLNFLNDWSRTFEDANRFNAYKLAREKFIKQGMDEKTARKKAGLVARDSSFDPMRRGKRSKELGTAFIFFNAATQSSINALKSLTNPRVAAKVATSLAALQTASFAYNSMWDEEWHDKVDGFARDFGISFVYGKEEDGTLKYLTIPVPYAVKPILTTTNYGLRKLHGYEDSNESLAKALTKSTLEAFSPLPVDIDNPQDMLFMTPVRPVFEIVANRDAFGNPIYPDTYNEVFDHVKAWDSTHDSHTGKALLWATQKAHELFGKDVSPESVDHFLQSYLGSVWKGGSNAIDILSGAITGEREFEPLQDIAIVNAFFRKVDKEQQHFRVEQKKREASGYDDGLKEVQSETYSKRQEIRNYVDDVMEDEDLDRSEHIQKIYQDVKDGRFEMNELEKIIERYEDMSVRDIAENALDVPKEDAYTYMYEEAKKSGMASAIGDIVEYYEDETSSMDAWEKSMKRSGRGTNKEKASLIAVRLDRIEDKEERIAKFREYLDNKLITKGISEELEKIGFQL